MTVLASRLKFLLSPVAVLLLAAAAFGQGHKLESSATPAPPDLAAPVSAALSSNAMHVTGASGPLCEIWLVKTLQPAATPDTSLGVNFGAITPGTLVGAVKFDAAGGDYRGQPIKPGVYTLRYMLQPVDGNHQGVSPYRDYLLAVPAALDTDAGNLTTDNVLKLSKKASGTGHPSVWSLVPDDNAPANLPGIAHQDDGGLWVVFFQAPLPKPVKMGLVVVGRAPEQE